MSHFFTRTISNLSLTKYKKFDNLPLFGIKNKKVRFSRNLTFLFIL